MTYPNGYGLTAEQAANEERHQRSLDRFFGPETREPRFAQQTAAPRPAMQYGGVQPQPRHQARQAASLPSFEAIEGRINMIPGMTRHLEGIDLDGDGVADIPLGPPPMDPMGRMQWQVMAEHRQRAMRQAVASRQWRKEQGNVAMLHMLASLDPLFERVNAKVEKFVSVLPPKIQKAFMRAVLETPGAYLELYKEMREMLMSRKRRACPRCGSTNRSAQAGRPLAKRSGKAAAGDAGWNSGWTLPPELESERQALIKRMRAGQAREGDSLRLLELSGL